MSPRGSQSSSSTHLTRNSTLPYSRRSTSQPKSSRQQFSACGACRMRRVRCDLKDLPVNSAGPYPTCSNCKERGIKCVDEFADVKAVKLLRRGRRLQQVEAIYGKTTDPDGNSSSSSLPSSTRFSTNIPTLHYDFFTSPFWHWFVIQRPILDPIEFPTRYAAHCKGEILLGNEGQLISMLLVVWAASFALNERGLVEGEPESPPSTENQSPGAKRRQRKTRTEVLLHEIMEHIDFYGLLRRPTLDGVRVLLLLLPLLEEAQPLERLAIYEATLSQVQALCVLSASSSPSFDDAAVRARIFWYAYTQEGITTGIRGGRFVLNNEDLDTFQRTLPPPNFNAGASSLPSPSSSSNSNGTELHLAESGQYIPRDLTFHKAYIHLITAASTPLDLSNVCRRIHSVLTGIKATRRAEHHGLVDANGMRDIWRDLDRCWDEFESEKRAPLEQDNVARRLERDLYTSGWQIFIFDCHNVIREGLKHFVSSFSSQAMYAGSASSRPSSHSSNSSPYLSPHHLLATATRKCMVLLPRVIRILQMHISSKRSELPGIFHWDAGLVRDGCFFAGYLAANMEGDVFDEDDLKQEDIKRCLTVEDGVSICLAALTSMRWSFSKSEEREETIRMIWENNKARRHSQHSPHYNSEYTKTLTVHQSQIPLHASNSHTPMPLSLSGERLPPLNLHMYPRRVESAPSTACSIDGRGMSGWPSYTPPSTATSVATSAGTGISGRGSPVFSNMPSFKGPSDDVFYHGISDLDHFSYHPPLTGPAVRDNSDMTINYPHRHSPIQPHASTTNYLAENTFNSTLHSDFNSCPQFGENCSGGYH